ncbi:MAG: DUF362 domain-containing protein [Anaerolineae bacterium]|nr:DUF362 domain-containing protein [Anaerolineae bacterium]MDW8102821.1 DUF362 domain-containing protein [Anaerolineae bacterium]
MSTVSIYEADAQDVGRVIARVFDAFEVDVKDKRVLIKPNIVAGLPPEHGATTHPAVVSALVKECLRRGASRVTVGDNPGGVEKDSRATAQKAGLVEASHGCFVRLSEKVTEVLLPSAGVKAPISSAVLEADFLINVPVMKTHVFTTITGAVKNLYGYVAGTAKARLHLAAPTRRQFSALLADIYALRPPDLVIMDALRVMEGNGPTHGQARPLGKILAGKDGVAVDAVACRMMGVDPAKVYHLVEASGRGLGRIDGVEVEGAFSVIPDFKLPTTFAASPQEQAMLLWAIGQVYPVLREDLCLQCGDCAVNCPAQAISLNPYPVVDENRCITCYCCVELCPEGAWEIPSGIQEKFDRIFR